MQLEKFVWDDYELRSEKIKSEQKILLGPSFPNEFSMNF